MIGFKPLKIYFEKVDKFLTFYFTKDAKTLYIVDIPCIDHFSCIDHWRELHCKLSKLIV